MHSAAPVSARAGMSATDAGTRRGDDGRRAGKVPAQATAIKKHTRPAAPDGPGTWVRPGTLKSLAVAGPAGVT